MALSVPPRRLNYSRTVPIDMHFLQMIPVLTASRLLVVDDDPTATLLSKLQLTRGGYDVTTVASVAEARDCLAAAGPGMFETVVTDFRMPGEDGLVMLSHVQSCDPTLSVILLTAEGEKSLVASSLRGGAHDFLEKPVRATALNEAVARAVATTRRRRRLRTDAAAARALGESQNNLLCLETALLHDRLRVRFHPHQRAGGDFTAAFELGAEKFVLLVSDVSGHDLRTAYHSAYLQGVARGMFERGASLDEVFANLNRLLLKDWNRSGATEGRVELSLCAFGIAVDFAAGSVACLNCGLPPPCLVEADGWPSTPLPPPESPLGWFEGVVPSTTWMNRGGTLHLWSDGLQDLAERQEVSPLALAYRLQLADSGAADLLAQATDDVLAVQLDLSPRADPARRPLPHPLLNETYAGSDLERIDSIQRYCENSLRLAIPSIGDESLVSAILCIRESLINALDHGCSRRTDRFARLQAVWSPDQQNLQIRVSDDGPGHSFNLNRHEQTMAVAPVGRHNGLFLIKNLATQTIFSPSANSVTMEFNI